MNDEREQSLLGRIDEELRQALDVAPSPAFLPRVREKVAREAAPRAWGLSWLVLAVAGAAAVAAAAWLLQSQPAPQSSPVAELRVERPALSATTAPAVPEARRAVKVVPVAATAQPAPQPEILVPPGQEEALRRFVSAIWSGQVDATAIIAGDAPSVLPDLVIAPLEVKPLTTETDTEGVAHD